MVWTRALVAGLIFGLAAREVVAKYIDIQDATTRARAIAALRERGSEGLDIALGFYDALIKKQSRLQEAASRLTSAAPAKTVFVQVNAGKSANSQDKLAEIRRQLADVTARLAGWREAIDQIGGQRTCSVSRLYWYTDLAAAQAEAKHTGRPILSLRMLGKLTDEFSCANSRFFRTALYSNSEISKFLRDNYVLHWQSVRPVPRVTIDFGDGRKLERTLTGNSAHYVLTSDGQPIDALPGLYSPHQFILWLQEMSEFHPRYVNAPGNERQASLRAFHEQKRKSTLFLWNMDIGQLGQTRVTSIAERINTALAIARMEGKKVPAALPAITAPDAVKAARVAVSKTVVEGPIFLLSNLGGKWMERGMDDELWQAIAELHRDEVKLDESSVSVMRREFPAAVAARLAESKRKQEDPLLRMVRSFEDSIALDTVRNEYLLHRRIHEQFAEAAEVTTNIDALNEWVYAELFLTPSSDPWLGLAPANAYTALENDGRTDTARSISTHSGG